MISFLKFIALLVGSYYILALIFAFAFLIVFAVAFIKSLHFDKSFNQMLKDHHDWKDRDHRDF